MISPYPMLPPPLPLATPRLQVRDFAPQLLRSPPAPPLPHPLPPQVRDFAPQLLPARVAIVRPSFIGALAGLPCPGYTGNLAGVWGGWGVGGGQEEGLGHSVSKVPQANAPPCPSPPPSFLLPSVPPSPVRPLRLCARIWSGLLHQGLLCVD